VIILKKQVLKILLLFNRTTI